MIIDFTKKKEENDLMSSFVDRTKNLSYTDFIDFCSEKISLKKLEISLGIHHQELGLKWDEPVTRVF